MLTSKQLDLIEQGAMDAVSDGLSQTAGGITVELVKMARRSEDLESALRGLSDMYSHAWDLVDGGLMMMGSSIPRFEEAHRQARIALGEPLVGDDGVDPDAAALGEIDAKQAN